MSLFRKRRHFASRKTRRPAKRYNVAREFKKQRTSSIKYALSATRFRISKFWRTLAAFSLIIAAVLGVIVFLFFSAFFSIQHIELIRQDFRADIETISKVTTPFRNKNIFLISKTEITNELKSNFPEIENVEIKRNLPRTIKIKVGTFPIAARWSFSVKPTEDIIAEAEKPESPNKYTIFINSIGNMSNGTTEDEDVFLIEEQDLRDKPFSFGERIVSPAFIKQLNESKKLLEEILEVSIVSAKYFRNAKEIHFIAGNGTAFWIDYATPQEEQIKKLKHVIAETDILNNKIEYFDLRVNERIFWKPKK